MRRDDERGLQEADALNGPSCGNCSKSFLASLIPKCRHMLTVDSLRCYYDTPNGRSQI